MIANKVEHTICEDLRLLDETYTIALSLTLFFPPESFPPNCKVIYGPHFFIFPDDTNHPLHKYNYNPKMFFYNTLTPWISTIFKKIAPHLSVTLISCPFGVNTSEIQIVPKSREKILIYYKNRHPSCLEFVKQFLGSRNLDYVVFTYGTYMEPDFKAQLQNTKFVIWIGRHESQGFAFQETLASNVPILLWDVHSCYDEYSNGYQFESYRPTGLELTATVANVWTPECGVRFYEAGEFESAFHEIVKNLDSYRPRICIEETLSLEATYKNLLHLIS